MFSPSLFSNTLILQGNILSNKKTTSYFYSFSFPNSYSATEVGSLVQYKGNLHLPTETKEASRQSFTSSYSLTHKFEIDSC